MSAAPANPAQVTEEALLAGEEAYWSAPKDEDGCTAMARAYAAITAAIGAGGQASGAVTFYDKDNCPVCYEPGGEASAELRQIEEMLDAGQGDDDGPQILPDFEPDMSTLAKVEACLFLLETRRDLIEAYQTKAPLSQPHPADERVVEALREAVAWIEHHHGYEPQDIRCSDCRKITGWRAALSAKEGR